MTKPTDEIDKEAGRIKPVKHLHGLSPIEDWIHHSQWLEQEKERLERENAALKSEREIYRKKIETSIAVLGRVDAAFNGVEDLGIADDVDTLRRQLRKAITGNIEQTIAFTDTNEEKTDD